ncbi:uncharacterized protein si:cabz01015814.1 isoform X2 [Danio rerio]|uniref:Uncharacterized protein si:cabz01015814.1 isoform X2 n=1 Tax=Danio rerio TaxID=7955 RepID=A0AC58JCG1_DANRE
MAFIKEECEDIRIADVFTLVKEEPEDPIGGSSVWNSCSFLRNSVTDLLESWADEFSSGEEFDPESQSDLNSKTELHLERSISNTTENSLEPCMTTERKSSSLNVTGDSLIHNLSSSPDLSPGSITKAEDENTTIKTEERDASIPEDTASDSVSSSKGITTKGGENFCFVCGKPQIKIARHFKVHKHENTEIARALSLPAHSKKRKELLQMLRNKGNFMHNNDVLKKGSGALKVKRRSVKRTANKYTYCVHCRGMFVCEVLKRHMKNCSAKRVHQEALGAQGPAEVANAAIPVCSSVSESHSFQSVPDSPESLDKDLLLGNKFDPESQSDLNSKTELDLERTISNTIENSLEPCMTTERKSSSLNITGDSLIHNLSSLPDLSPSSITKAEDKNTSIKREERDTSIPEDTASDSVSSSKGITTRGGENFCFVCGKPQIKIARHFKVHKRDNAEIARALSLPAHSKKRKELLQMLRNKGNFMHNNDVLKKGSGALKVKRHSVKRTANKYTYCVHCRGMFIREELWRHMKKCSAKRDHQETLGAQGPAEVAKAAIPVCSSVCDSQSFQSKSVPDLPESLDKDLLRGNEFVPESQSDLNSKTEQDLERSISNTTENSLEPCITTERKSSSLNVTAEDLLIHNLSSSPDLTPSSITKAEDENTTIKREERDTSIPEDTASDSVSSSKCITTRGGENFCFVCRKPQIKIGRHFKVHKRDNAEIARALSLPAHSKKRKELLQMLRNKGNFMHNNDVLKKGSGALKVKRHSVKRTANKYTYCVHCRGMFIREELWRHTKKCSAKRDHQEALGAQGPAEVAKAAIPVCSSVCDSQSFQSKSVPDLPECLDKDLLRGNEFVPESQSDLNSKTEQDLERTNSNTTENSLEPCMTTERKSSSLNITAEDSLIHNLSSSSDLSPSSITKAENENTTIKTEERDASIPEDTASDSVLPSKGITTRGGENFCFVCGKPQIKIARHFIVHKRDNAEIARALSLPAHSKKRKELLQMLRNKGNFMHNNDVLKKGSGALKVKRRSVKQASNKYTYCVYCRGMFIRQELKRHMKNCSAKRDHLGALGPAEVAKAVIPVCSAVLESHSFHKKSVPGLSESCEQELPSVEEFVPESQSGLNSNTELDLERSTSNTTENLLEPCMTSEKKASSLNITAGDSLIHNLSFSPDLSPSSFIEAEDENTTNKREERDTSIPEDTASDSVSSSKGITTRGGENFCFVCGKPQIKIARHFIVHKRDNAEIARALSLPAHSKKRKELLQMLRNKGNFMHNNEVLKKGSGALKVKRHSVKQASNKYTYCVYCRGMFIRQELWRHMRNCSAKRDHQETLGALGLAEVAKAAFPVCSSVWYSHSFQSKSVPILTSKRGRKGLVKRVWTTSEV